jgi:hypothetical protein
VLVKEWQLTCTMFDGDQLLGPVPTLFADNVEVKISCYKETIIKKLIVIFSEQINA